MTKQELLDKANDLPLAPGVYLMMDKTGCVIYVGKAKKLKTASASIFRRIPPTMRKRAAWSRRSTTLTRSSSRPSSRR